MSSGKFFAKRSDKEIKAFLEAHGYKQLAANGDDQIWARDDCAYTVKVSDRSEDRIPRGTLDQIKKMLGMAGFDRKYVLKWWKDNGYGE